MSTTMKAYRWNGPGTRLELCSDIPRPHPSAGQVLISIEACGLCHSDCGFLNNSNPDAITKIPITLGHEIAGNVIAVGDGVDAHDWLHQRVAISLGGHPARISPNVVGLEIDGGYADFVVVPATALVRLPDTVSFPQGAVAVDAFTTAYHCVCADQAGAVKAGMNVAVVGLGGVGMAALRIAVLRGAHVWGVDIDERKFETARENGATACCTHLERAEGVVFDVVLDLVGISDTLSAALKAVTYCGVVVLVGIGSPSITLKTFDVIWNNVQIRGSLGGSMDDLHEVLRLIEAGQLRPQLEEIPFDKVPQGLDRLEEGKVLGRLFTRPQAPSIQAGEH